MSGKHAYVNSVDSQVIYAVYLFEAVGESFILLNEQKWAIVSPEFGSKSTLTGAADQY